MATESQVFSGKEINVRQSHHFVQWIHDTQQPDPGQLPQEYKLTASVKDGNTTNRLPMYHISNLPHQRTDTSILHVFLWKN